MPFTQIRNNQTVVLLDHFVKKKVVPIHSHFPYNSLESTEPRVGHLCCRRIKSPFASFDEIGELNRVTPFIAKSVGFTMFCLHVKYVYWKCASIEIMVICRIEVFFQVTVVVEEVDTGNGLGSGEELLMEKL